MKRLLFCLISITTFISLSAQTNTKKTMTPADSVAAERAKENKFVDSVLSKTSLKDFQLFLDDAVSAKQLREGTYFQLQNFFIQAKYNEWMQKLKQKPQN